MDVASVAFMAGAMIAVLPQYFAIRRARRQHAGHVFSLWYLFGLSLVIVSCLFAYIYINVATRGHPDLQGWPANVVVFLFDAALDIRGESVLCRRRKRFSSCPSALGLFRERTLWLRPSPIGVKMDRRLHRLGPDQVLHRPGRHHGCAGNLRDLWSPLSVAKEIPSRLFYMSLFLSVSFTIFVFYCARENILLALDRLGLRTGLSNIHRFMTRYANEQASETSRDSLEEMIFDSLSQWLLGRVVKLIARKIRRHDQLQGV